MLRNLTLTTLLIAMIAMVAASGCRPADEIVVHQIPKSQSDLDKFNRAPLPTRPAAAAAVPTRMVAALALRDDATWFFKISGPVEQVNLSEPAWREFFSKLTFADDGKPKWQLPTGWSEGPEKAMRDATLLINDSQPPLEMSISHLPPGQDLVGNVNRWRGQLALDPISGGELDLAKISYLGGEMMLFDEIGSSSGGGMGGPMAGGPMSGGPPAGHPPIGNSVTPPPNVPSDSTPDEIKFTPPAGWETGPNSSIVKARLLKSEGDQQAQITVVEMAAAANEWGPNVVRWAGEIGMTDLSGPAADERTSTVVVDGIEGQRVRLIEPEDQYKRATVAVMVKRGASAWFLKISGDKSVVEASEPDFEAFLSSFKFEDIN
jgi:hypothetical protein